MKKNAKQLKRFLQGNSLGFCSFKKTFTSYNWTSFKGDSSAGFNVALLAIPQGMAYAAIADLPIAFGILCTAIAALIAPFFSSSEFTNLGPTNATALLISSFFAQNMHLIEAKESLVPLIVILAGIICIIGAYSKAAELMQYVSKSVLVGYISVAAILIITKQAKHIFGIADYVNGANFFSIVKKIGAEIWRINPYSVGVSAATLILYFVIKKYFKKLPAFAIVLILATAAVSFISATWPESGIANLAKFSAFNLSDLAPQGGKILGTNIFNDFSEILTIAIAVAFLAMLENTSMAKSLASKAGTHSDVNQDTLAVGVSNLATGFFAGMPSSGSLTRSALNYTSGAVTRMSSWISGAASLAAVFALAFFPLTAYIPKAVLSSLVIAIALSLFNPRLIGICLRTTFADGAVLIITFITALFAPLHVAIFIGVAISVGLFLRKVSRPDMVEYTFDNGGQLKQLGQAKKEDKAISIVHVEGSLFFGAAELFQNQMKRLVHEPDIACVVLRLKNARHLDATSVIALEELIQFLRKRDRFVLISGATREVYRVLKKSGVLKTVQEGTDRSKGESNLFLVDNQNPNLSTRNALLRAQTLLGDKNAEIKIYINPNKK